MKVYKVHWYWWWSSDNGSLANYVSNSYNKPVKTFTIRTGTNGTASFNLKYTDADWGTYFISVKDKESKHSTGVMNYFDWPYSEGRRDADGSSSANMLTFKTDKDTYAPGEQIVVTFPSVKGSRAIISIENGTRVLSTTEHMCNDGQTTVKLAVTPDMQPNAYLYITLLQPHGVTKNDLPIRMYGVVPFTVTSPESHLAPIIHMADEVKPEAPCRVMVSEKNGREMAYTLAIVDEGLLDLTRFRTPDPWQAFNAREALGVNTWDLYNYVVGAYGGRIEQLFSIGGDDALNKGPKAIVNRFKPVVQFAGPFLLKKGENGSIPIRCRTTTAVSASWSSPETGRLTATGEERARAQACYAARYTPARYRHRRGDGGSCYRLCHRKRSWRRAGHDRLLRQYGGSRREEPYAAL